MSPDLQQGLCYLAKAAYHLTCWWFGIPWDFGVLNALLTCSCGG